MFRKMMIPIIAFVAYMNMATSAQAAPKNLHVQPNTKYQLAPGHHNFNTITMGHNATIELVGSTSISVGMLRTSTGARFQYKPGSTAQYKSFRLTVIDGSEIKGNLYIVGNGAHGQNGRTGGNGNDGVDESFKVKITWKGPKIEHRNPTSGGNGGRGENGLPGEDAMDIELNIFKLGENGLISIAANGGNGGDGGHGGNGGRGGRGKHVKKGQNAGHGGNGGNGANGGNGGSIRAHLVHHPDASEEARVRLLAHLKKHVKATPGIPGAGGDGGKGGAGGIGGPGAKGPLFKRGGGGNGRGGHGGYNGKSGRDGSLVRQLLSFDDFLKTRRNLILQLFGEQQ